jgi:hypothetical protein
LGAVAVAAALWLVAMGPEPPQPVRGDSRSEVAQAKSKAGEVPGLRPIVAARTPASEVSEEQTRTAVGSEGGRQGRNPRADAYGGRARSVAKSRTEGAHPRLDENYVRSILTDSLISIAKECYADAARQDPDLAGMLTLRTNLAGDSEVGGVVEQVEIVEVESSLVHVELTDCVRESAYVIEFPPPEAGVGNAEVSFTIDFHPEEPE